MHVLERVGHRLMRRVDQLGVPRSLRRRWRAVPAGADPIWADRLRRDRSEIVPWLASLADLNGATVLEIGSGRGASTFALAEQGADVTAVDVNEQAIAYAERQLATTDLNARFRNLNANHLDEINAPPFDLVVFWASLEHMVVHERIAALRQGWCHVADGSTLAVIETPNRLWPDDSHTSRLPFFNWLPDEVAFPYLANTERTGLGSFTDPDTEMLRFQRLGRGVSYHEFELALGANVVPSSCMQLERRRSNPLRGLAWACSEAGRVERTLRRFAPNVHRAWFQPFLYLAMTKPQARVATG